MSESERINFTAGVQALGHDARGLDVTRLVGGASNRTYHRVRAVGGASWVVMVLPDDAMASEEAVVRGQRDESELPFLQLARFLGDRDVPVPRVHHVDSARGHVWLDDLGDHTMLDVLAVRDRMALYREAIAVLVALQRATEREPESAPVCFRRRFEPSLLRWELDHYREWRLEHGLGRSLTDATLAALSAEFDALVAAIAAQPHRVAHRDFQSTNLMATARGLVLIDFQDALVAPWTYDLVALLRDSYVTLAPAEVAQLVEVYLVHRPELDAVAFRRDVALQTVQRKLKDAGRFVYIDRVKGNPSYLRWIEPTLGFVRDALRAAPEFGRLRELLAGLDPALR